MAEMTSLKMKCLSITSGGKVQSEAGLHIRRTAKISKMPAFVTCRNRGPLEMEWNVASDDFVIPAFISVVFNLLRSNSVPEILLKLYVHCCD